MKPIPKALTWVSFVVAFLCILVFVRCSSTEEVVEVRQPLEVVEETARFDWDAWEREREERWAREEAEREAGRAQMEAEAAEYVKANEKRQRLRRRQARDKMWLLKSPSAIREALWAIPRVGGHEATVEGLLRVCVSEAGWRPEGLRDCVWIWQVTQNIRARKNCVVGDYRGITECGEGGESDLSAMRRLSGRVLDESKARTVRQRFISKLASSCERPLFFPRGDSWERNLKRPCERIASEVRAIVRLKADRNLTNGAVPIAWGGRCEDSGGACDDEMACRRGLARIPGSDTYNAFWCRPGSRGCSAEIDPVCGRYRPSPEVATSEQEEEEVEEPLGG